LILLNKSNFKQFLQARPKLNIKIPIHATVKEAQICCPAEKNKYKQTVCYVKNINSGTLNCSALACSTVGNKKFNNQKMTALSLAKKVLSKALSN